jgi:hypothetical protein
VLRRQFRNHLLGSELRVPLPYAGYKNSGSRQAINPPPDLFLHLTMRDTGHTTVRQ